MNLHLVVTDVISYSDGPEIIEALDRNGGHFIGLVSNSDTLTFKVILVGVPPDEINRYRVGEVDLRSLVEAAAPHGWYICETNDLSSGIEAIGQTDSIPEHMLPLTGGFLRENLDKEKDAVLRSATQRQNFVVLLKFEPKDHLRQHRMNLRRFADVIGELHDLIALSGTSGTTGRMRTEIREKLSVDVVDSPREGSLELLLEASSADNDMFNPHMHLVQAFSRIDKAIASDITESSIKELSGKFGHEFAIGLIALLKKIEASEIDFNYFWTEPHVESVGGNGMKLADVKATLAILDEKSDSVLHKESRTYTGAFVQFNTKSGKWGLQTESGLVVGDSDESDSVSLLSGLVVDETYTFYCEEILKFGQAWQNAKPTLVLKEIGKPND